jgi:hypothetical protein
MNPAMQAVPQPIESATPDVAMNPAGIEADPNYLDGDYVVSSLTGERLKTSDFKHNNMVPFFGGRVRQNVAANTNSGILDSFTGSGVTQIAKKEVETMFDTAQAPYGNPFGLESATDFVQSRMNDPRSRAGERPFEPVRRGPGVRRRVQVDGAEEHAVEVQGDDAVRGEYRQWHHVDEPEQHQRPQSQCAAQVAAGQFGQCIARRRMGRNGHDCSSSRLVTASGFMTT